MTPDGEQVHQMILLSILFTDFWALLQAAIISYLIDTLQRFFAYCVTGYELFHGMWGIVLQNFLRYSG